MNNIDEYLYKYGLHDCVVEKVYTQNNSLAFCFNTGVYKLDEKGTETAKTTNCLMLLELEDLDCKQIWKHVEVLKINKNKIYEINFEKFIEDVSKFKFEIDENYLSYFGQSILLDGYAFKNRYQIKISEILKIKFIFK